MKIRSVLPLLATLALAPLSALAGAASTVPQAKPNIIYILLDDAGYGDLGSYGQKTLLTPHMDRLASEGMKFTRHYSGSTVCAPSRGVLMTGLHTGHSRIRGNGPSYLPDTDLNVARLLKDAGYHTACIGKYGLGSPLPLDDPQRKGFDYFFGYVGTAHAHNFYTDFLVRWPGKIKPGTVSEHVSGFQDILPTAADLAGAKVTADTDGLSFLPTLLGNSAGQKQHPYLVWYFNEQGGKKAVLQWPWKLIHLNTATAAPTISSDQATPARTAAAPKPLVVQLFNLATDATESVNLAGENSAKVKELEAILQQAWKDPS